MAKRRVGAIADRVMIRVANWTGWEISEAERARQAQVCERMRHEGLYGLQPDPSYRFRGKDWPMWLYCGEGLFWRLLELPGSWFSRWYCRLRRWVLGV